MFGRCFPLAAAVGATAGACAARAMLAVKARVSRVARRRAAHQRLSGMGGGVMGLSRFSWESGECEMSRAMRPSQNAMSFIAF